MPHNLVVLRVRSFVGLRRISRRAFAAMMTFGALLALPACGASGNDLPTYRYRLTVEVETPEGVKSGSSVIEVSAALAGKYSIPDPGKLSIQYTGEAVAVDLGQRGVLFALLRSEKSPEWAGSAVALVTPPPPVTTKNYYAVWHARMVTNTGVHELPRNSPFTHWSFDPPIKPSDPPKDYPMLVRFTNITDPKTVEKVDPDDLAKSFGAGVKLKRITVQLTDDPVTFGVERRLTWLMKLEGMGLKSADFPTDIPVGDFSGMFQRGAK
jgi:hypothetical protein